MSYRPTVFGTRHAISAGHYLAASAGFSILEGGGNAIDAGVAAGIALGVLQPDLVNFAGVAPILIRLGGWHNGKYRRSGLVAEGAPGRSVHARSRRDNPGRRAANCRSCRARRLDHRAAQAWHDAVRRCRGFGHPFFCRRICRLSAFGTIDRCTRGGISPVGVQRRGIFAWGTGARDRGQVRADRSGRDDQVHGRSGPRHGIGPDCGTQCRAPRVLSRRYCSRYRTLPAAGSRISVDGGYGGLQFRYRACRAPVVARARVGDVRGMVPRAGPAAGSGTSRAGRPRWAGT